MTLHIDVYSYEGMIPGRWRETPKRQFEGQEAIDYANGIGAQKGLPYFNGYTLQTALHDDGECEQHQPKGKVWTREVPVDGR